ncbi:F0F1 ATP synthase subunit B [Tranquillimonas alkanivorans]|uniref:ATP synthase subunit b n=1 Tax=Tranquillimonas alkanivorans TaxID=441119 RepID=A0A1I5TG60_9RHOB|nr:F0F1 ATP synthase subunit B [Tranquillimonas alkanivorans]SFP81657.1 F-type H+-transporting ATPase subunit b [Tranquillimonas alkanivorans]
MRVLTIALTLATASPALAATGPFFSLGNTNFVVLLAFLVFIGILIYFKVPGRLMGMLDQRAEGIRSDLDEARKLREEAQTLLASYERKQAEVKEQADRIVANAREDSREAAEQAKRDLKDSIARRMQAAEDQIASAEAAAVRQVRDRAVEIAVAAAGEVIAKQMSAQKANALIDDSIKTVQAKLH